MSYHNLSQDCSTARHSGDKTMPRWAGPKGPSCCFRPGLTSPSTEPGGAAVPLNLNGPHHGQSCTSVQELPPSPWPGRPGSLLPLGSTLPAVDSAATVAIQARAAPPSGAAQQRASCTAGAARGSLARRACHSVPPGAARGPGSARSTRPFTQDIAEAATWHSTSTETKMRS